MVNAFYADNDRFQVVQNDEISFDTDRPSIELFPPSTHIVNNALSIEFPGFFQSYAYYRGAPSGLTECELWSIIFWQEWGPDEVYKNEEYYPLSPGNSIPGPTTRNLPRITLGTVPAETNHLDIRVNLTRTVIPPAWFYGVPRVMFKEGEEISLSSGGSCPVETCGGSARSFNITLGTAASGQPKPVYLERYQSVENYNTLNAPGNYSQAAITVNQSGWNSERYIAQNDAGGNCAPRTLWMLGTLLDKRGPDTNGTKRPNGTNPCSGSLKDLRSVFTGSIVIAPGRASA